MTDEAEIESIRKLKKRSENATIALGVTISTILILYFFSFATLIDKAPPAFITVQAVTTVLFVVALFFLKKIAYSFTKLTLGRRSPYRQLLANLTAKDLDKDETELYEQIRASKQE